MKTVTTREAQHHLSKVLEMVKAGEEVIITRRGEKVARLSPVEEENLTERVVDWSESIARIKERLSDMPNVGKNAVLEERESYKW